MIQKSFYRLTFGQVLLSSFIVFITIISIHQCAPSLTTIDKPKHYSAVDTMEIFNTKTYQSEIKIVSTEYNYYTNIPELPYIKNCESKSLKEQNRCTQSAIVNNIKNDPKVIAEFRKLNRNVSTELILIISENPITDWPELRIRNCEENLEGAIRNSFYNQKYEFMSGKVNGAPVNVHLKIPFTWKK